MDSTIDRLARIETKLDTLLEDHKETKTRLRQLEGWQGKLIGLASIVGSLLTAAVMKIFNI